MTPNAKLALLDVGGGVLVPVNRPRISAQEIIEQLRDVLSTPYDGADMSKNGLTKGEAALLSIARKAQEGDLDSIKYLHDRLMGKPVQSTVNLNVDSDLKTFLNELIDADRPEGVFDE